MRCACVVLLWVVACTPAAEGEGEGEGEGEVVAGIQRVAAGGPGEVCVLDDAGAIRCTGTTPPAGEAFVDIQSGFGFGCALRDDDTIACWGVGALALDGSYLALTAGGGFGGGPRAVCGISIDGALDCDATATSFAVPAGELIAASTSGPHLCAIDVDGAVTCDGNPALTPPAGVFTSVSVGYNAALGAPAHACGIRDDETMACWGKNEFGESDAPAGSFTAVSVGRDHSCAIADDESVVCWGADDVGQSSPPTNLHATQISAAVEGFTCAVTVNGDALCFGDAPPLPLDDT